MIGATGLFRSLTIFLLVTLPIYALTGAMVSVVSPVASTGSFWRDVVGWAAMGWWVPVLLLPSAVALHVLAARLPGAWTAARRRAVLVGVAPLLFVANFGAAAVALTGDAPLLRSPHILILVVPALAYAALLRLPSHDGS